MLAKQELSSSGIAKVFAFQKILIVALTLERVCCITVGSPGFQDIHTMGCWDVPN